MDIWNSTVYAIARSNVENTTNENHISHQAFLKVITTLYHTLIDNLFHIHNAADTVTLLHLLEGSVDISEGLAVGDELVNLQLAVQVVVDQTGQLGAALDTTESTSLPHTTGDQLECCARNHR